MVRVEAEETTDEINKENAKTENGSQTALSSPRPQRTHQNKLMCLKHHFRATYDEFKKKQKELKLKKLSLVPGFKEHPDYLKASAIFDQEDDEVKELVKGWEARHEAEASERKRKTNEKRALARKEAKDKLRAEEEAANNAKHDSKENRSESRKRPLPPTFERRVLSEVQKYLRQDRDAREDAAFDFIQRIRDVMCDEE